MWRQRGRGAARGTTERSTDSPITNVHYELCTVAAVSMSGASYEQFTCQRMHPPPPSVSLRALNGDASLEPAARFVSVQMRFHLLWIIALTRGPAGDERATITLPSGISGPRVRKSLICYFRSRPLPSTSLTIHCIHTIRCFRDY
jgi:hypothetical protein